MNVTLSIDDRVLAKARRIAAARGTSLNQMIRDYLESLTHEGEVTEVVNELRTLWTKSSGRSEAPWSRDEIHERG